MKSIAMGTYLSRRTCKVCQGEKENRAHWSCDVGEINHKAVIRFK